MEVPDESETSLLNSGQPWSPAQAQVQAPAQAQGGRQESPNLQGLF